MKQRIRWENKNFDDTGTLKDETHKHTVHALTIYYDRPDKVLSSHLVSYTVIIIQKLLEKAK